MRILKRDLCNSGGWKSWDMIIQYDSITIRVTKNELWVHVQRNRDDSEYDGILTTEIHNMD